MTLPKNKINPSIIIALKLYKWVSTTHTVSLIR